MKFDALDKRQKLPGYQKIIQSGASVFSAAIVFRPPPGICSFSAGVECSERINSAKQEQLMKTVADFRSKKGGIRFVLSVLWIAVNIGASGVEVSAKNKGLVLLQSAYICLKRCIPF